MLTFFSPAKINFFFHVKEKRTDGYHEIVSLLHTVSFGDYITFTSSQTDYFTVEGNEKVPVDNSNLIIQARDLFRSTTNWTQPLHIHLQKNIPIGSGLGGGSSNAATTLWALNHISKRGISKNELQKWSAELGSDVPFFFSNGCAVCTGRGEIVEDKPAIIERDIYLILNDRNINTAKVFSHVVPSNETIDIPKLIAETLEKKYPCINELEKAAYKGYPSLCGRKKDISEHFTGSIFMSGSGGTFVAIGMPRKELTSQYPLMKKVQCIEILRKGWYRDRKLLMIDLESKINALKIILPKEMSVLSIPGISVNAYELYMYYSNRMVEHAESSYDDFLENREISCISSVRSAQEVEAMLYMFRTKIKKSIEVKSLDKINKFFKEAICGTKFDKRNAEDKITPTKPVHISEAIRERKKTWPGCECVYDCDSEFTHPNPMGMDNYVSPIDPNTQMIYFGRRDVECRLDIIESLLTYLDDLINSYDRDMKLLDHFKNLCTEKEKVKIEL